MDMTIPIVLTLQVCGNILLFWGLYKFMRLTVFKKPSQEESQAGNEEPDLEMKAIYRELKRL